MLLFFFLKLKSLVRVCCFERPAVVLAWHVFKENTDRFVLVGVRITRCQCDLIPRWYQIDSRPRRWINKDLVVSAYPSPAAAIPVGPWLSVSDCQSVTASQWVRPVGQARRIVCGRARRAPALQGSQACLLAHLHDGAEVQDDSLKLVLKASAESFRGLIGKISQKVLPIKFSLFFFK